MIANLFFELSQLLFESEDLFLVVDGMRLKLFAPCLELMLGFEVE